MLHDPLSSIVAASLVPLWLPIWVRTWAELTNHYALDTYPYLMHKRPHRAGSRFRSVKLFLQSAVPLLLCGLKHRYHSPPLLSHQPPMLCPSGHEHRLAWYVNCFDVEAEPSSVSSTTCTRLPTSCGTLLGSSGSVALCLTERSIPHLGISCFSIS